MKLYIAIVLVLFSLQLAAEMAFSQICSIPIEKGDFSYAEQRHFHGDDRFVVYSQDADSIYISVYDLEGNPMEALHLAMTDETDARRMTFFEYDGLPHLAISRVEIGEVEDTDEGWERSNQVIGQIYNLDTGAIVTSRIILSIQSSYAHGDDFHSSSIYTTILDQPDFYATDEGDSHVLIPFTTRCSFSHWVGGSAGTDGVQEKTYLFEFTLTEEGIQPELISNAGYDVITGDIPGYPMINSGRSVRKEESNGENQSTSHTFAYSDVCILEEDNFVFGSGLFNARYMLLSDNYPGEPASFTMLSVDYIMENVMDYEIEFTERDMNGEVQWSATSTCFETDMLLEGKCVSGCFDSYYGVHMVIYFAPGTNLWETRDRWNGNLEDMGIADFTPFNIERSANRDLIFFSYDHGDVEMWYGWHTVSVDDNDALEIALNVSNYPNPFNPTTTIRFTIPASGNVELHVYNTRGQCVKTLVDERLDAGAHEAAWNGDDSRGNMVSSGVYLYRICIADRSVTGKMLLLK